MILFFRTSNVVRCDFLLMLVFMNRSRISRIIFSTHFLGFLVSFSNVTVEFWFKQNKVKVLCVTTEVTSPLQYVTY